MVLGANGIWSDRAMAGGDQHAASGPHGDGAQRALSSGRVKTADGLTHKDLLDLEALRVQGFKEVEAQIQREMEKRKGENSGSGSFQSVLGGVGVVQGSKTPVDPALGHLVTPPGLPGLPGPAVPASVTPAPVVIVGLWRLACHCGSVDVGSEWNEQSMVGSGVGRCGQDLCSVGDINATPKVAPEGGVSE